MGSVIMFVVVRGPLTLSDVSVSLRFRCNVQRIAATDNSLPTRLPDAGNQALVGQFPEANPADAEFPIHGPRPATQLATALAAGAELRRPLRFGDFRFTCHRTFDSLFGSLGRVTDPSCSVARLAVSSRLERQAKLPRSSSRDSSSLLDLVEQLIVMFMPCTSRVLVRIEFRETPAVR